MKKTLTTFLAIIGLAVLAILMSMLIPGERAQAPVDSQGETAEPQETSPEYQTVTFTGELQEINQGCIVDAPCSITVDGNVIQTSPGFVTEEYALSLGIGNGSGNVDEITALVDTDQVTSLSSRQYVFVPNEPIMVEGYVRAHDDGMYSVYGSDDFFVRIVE